jgi:molybdopterin-containing oxidoreductase family membrane subunit
MVLTLLIPIRRIMGLEDYITIRHLENLCKLIIVTLLIVKMSYLTEFWVAWYSGNVYEHYVFLNRAVGHYAWCFWTMIACNTLIPQLFWFKRLRTNVAVMFVISILINLGMWMERFVIVVTSLHRDFLPSSWAVYTPTLVEISILIGSFGLFFTCYLLFMRLFPVISMSEVKGVLSYGHGRLAPIPAAEGPAVREGSTDGSEQGVGP